MISPSRISLARSRRGLTANRLAELVGVARQTVAAWESGKQQPGPEAVSALARHLGFPESFFEAPDLEPFPVGAVSFRALSKTTASAREIALAAGRSAMLINEWLEAHYTLPESDVPTLGLQSPSQAADVLRARWGLGHAPIGNMVHLLEAKGVRVFSLPSECASVDAYSLRWQDKPVVVLTPGKTAERRRFDLAHELGHLVLHSEREQFQGPRAEDEANQFAAAFLMPRSGLLGRPLRSATLDMLLAERRRWKVSAMALAHRLHELKFLSAWEYRNHCVELSQLGYRRGEPGGIPHEASLILRKVSDSLRKRGQSLSDVAEEVHLSLDDFAMHLLGLVVMPLPAGTDSSRLVQPQTRVGTLRLAYAAD